MGTNRRNLADWIELGEAFNGRTMFRRKSQVQGSSSAADRHQADIDRAVGMLISSRVSLSAWYRQLRELCKLDSTLSRALEAAGLETVIDADGQRYLALGQVESGR
jgi:hypothetical protein